MSRGTRAIVDLSALQHNLSMVRRAAPASRVVAVVKADAYGHGLVPVARALSATADALGVATFDEAMALKESGVGRPILLMEGVLSIEQLQQASQQQFQVVVHQPWQLAMLLDAHLPVALVIWLKVDTGMHRLGMAATGCGALWQQLQSSPNVKDLVLMSHLACADEPEHVLNQQQEERFAELMRSMNVDQASLANSAATLNRPGVHYQWVRPGLMLYGGSPLLMRSAEALELKPVMHLQSRIIARTEVSAGQSVGYGATWTASRKTDVAVVAIGYGDGYPRHIGSGAQVLIEGVRCPLVGRVSMDMITVDVTGVPAVSPNAEVTLWGPGLPVEEVAQWAGTINYELLCQVTGRVERVYRHADNRVDECQSG